MSSPATQSGPGPAAGFHAPQGLLRVGFGLEELGRWCLRAPKVALGLLIAVTAAAAVLGQNVGFNDNIYEIYRNDGKEYVQFSAFQQLFPTVQNRLIAVFEGPAVTTREGLEIIRDVHLELEWMEGVLGATSIFSIRERASPGESPALVMPAAIPEGAALDRVFDRLEEHPLAGERLLSLDPPATLISVALDPSGDEFEIAPRVADTVNKLVGDQAEAADLQVRFTGSPLLRLEILSSLRRDQAVLKVVGIVISFLVCLTFFGRWRYVMTAVVPGIVGVLWTLGAFTLVGQPINVLNSVLPTLVTVIAMADALHMTSAVRTGLGEGLTAREAARRAVDEVGPACAMTMLTTSVVFLCFTISESTAIRDFGLAGALASLLAYFAVITIVPCLSALLMRPLEGKRQEAGAAAYLFRMCDVITHASARLIQRRPRTVAGVSTALLAVCTVAYFSVEPSYTYREFLPDRSDANRAIERIDELFTGADSAQILIRRNDEWTEQSRRPAEVVREIHEIAARTEGFSHVESLVTVEQWLARDLSAWAEGEVEEDIGLPEHVANRIRAPDHSAWLVNASLPALDASESVPIFDRLEVSLDEVRAESPGYDIFLTGVVPMTAWSGVHLISQLNWSLIAAIVITMALIGIALRSLVMGLMVAPPNLLPLAAVGTALYLAGEGMQITSVVALTIAFGLAVDDTVHLVHRWQLERRRTAPREAAIKALDHVGPVLIATTMVLVSGMIATAVSGLPVVRLFGALCMITFVAALLADLLLMPALLVSFSRLFTKPPKE